MQRLAGFEQMRALPGIDHDDAFAAVDDPYIGREPIGPDGVGKNREPPRPSMAASFDLRGLDPDKAGLNRVNFHGGLCE
jgi:hypothetical protein